MIQRIAVVALMLLPIGGCSHTPEPAPSSDHPANPRAAEAPPSKVKSPQATAAGQDAVPTVYTCPHHPKVMQADAGECPLCGMKLVPTASRQTSPVRGVGANEEHR